MREILFRGKRKDNGEWVEGAFSQYDCNDPFGAAEEIPSIIKYGEPCSLFWFEVDPETVGQYTGKKDKNGKMIFEGDVVKKSWVHHYYVGNERREEINEFIGVIVYDCCSFGMAVDGENFSEFIGTDHNGEWLEVIGNIHDNPELLEGGASQ